MIYQHNGMISSHQQICPSGIFEDIERCYRYDHCEWGEKQDSEL